MGTNDSSFSALFISIFKYQYNFNIINYSLNLSAVVFDKNFFDDKTEYRDMVKNIYNLITTITKEENMGDIDVHVLQGMQVYNLRGKNELNI